MTINYIVDDDNQDFLDTNTAPNVAYWIDGALAFTNEKHLEYINTVGGFGLDIPAFISSIKVETENENIEQDPVNNSSRFYAYTERTTQLKTSAYDITYLEITVEVPTERLYMITYGMNMRYEKKGTQYIKYKVDVDDTLYVSNPYNSGWVEAEVWYNESSQSKGLDFHNARSLLLNEGSHTIRLKIGRTGSKKVIANYGFLQIEEK